MSHSPRASKGRVVYERAIHSNPSAHNKTHKSWAEGCQGSMMISVMDGGFGDGCAVVHTHRPSNMASWMACMQVVSYRAGAGLGSTPVEATPSAARKRKRGGAKNRQKWVV